MQIQSLRIKSYRSWRVDESDNATIAAFREEKIKHFEKLRREGCSENTALEVIGVARSTLYRWRCNYKRFGFNGLKPQNRTPINKNKLNARSTLSSGGRLVFGCAIASSITVA